MQFARFAGSNARKSLRRMAAHPGCSPPRGCAQGSGSVSKRAHPCSPRGLQGTQVPWPGWCGGRRSPHRGSRWGSAGRGRTCPGRRKEGSPLRPRASAVPLPSGRPATQGRGLYARCAACPSQASSAQREAALGAGVRLSGRTPARGAGRAQLATRRAATPFSTPSAATLSRRPLPGSKKTTEARGSPQSHHKSCPRTYPDRTPRAPA